jgi:superfamily II DNA or RNA helicase
MIRLLVGNTVTYVDGYLESPVYKALRANLGYRPEEALYMAKNMPHWDGMISTICYKGRCNCPIKKDKIHFPSGLLAKAWEIFDGYKVEYTTIDQRDEIPMTDCFLFGSEKPLRPYQQDIVDIAVKRGRGILKLATGGGKTVVAAALIARLGVTPFIFYVPSQDLLRQAYEELSLMLKHKDGSPVKIGRVGGGYREIEDVTVMTVQSAVRALDPDRFVTKDKNGKVRKKKVKLFESEDEAGSSLEDNTELGEYREAVKKQIQSCRGMICDETHHWASDTCQLVADHSLSCRYRFGFSATPWRDKGDDILIDACFGKVIADINASYLIDHKDQNGRSFLVPPTIYFVPVSNMKNTRFADYHEAYEIGIVRNELRNKWAAQIASNLADSGRQVLILIKNIVHGELLEEMIPGSIFLHGEKTPAQRKLHLDLMRERKTRITIASVIFDEGIDVRPLDALVLLGGGKSQTRALQRVGRVIRPYQLGDFVKTDAVVVDFNDDMKWMRKHSAARKKVYRSEERFEIKELTLKP